jgi:hypothetical protein
MIGRGSNKHRQKNNYNKKFDLILKAFGVDQGFSTCVPWNTSVPRCQI